MKENKNNVELHIPNDLLMKESTGNFDKNKSENETVTLHNVGDNLNLGINVRILSIEFLNMNIVKNNISLAHIKISILVQHYILVT